MEVFDSKKKRLSMQEIMIRALKNQLDTINVPLEVALLQLVEEIKMPGSEALQIGNTVFITHYSPESKVCAMFALNVDSARNYINNGEVYVRRLMSKGMKGFMTSYTKESFGVPFKQLEKLHLGIVQTNKKDGKFVTSVLFNKAIKQEKNNV